ncbi:hypothetical protein BRARA_I02939, partial [Brassica rapa]
MDAPPDPPDLNPRLSPIQFPPLSSSTPKQTRASRRLSPPTSDVVMTQSSPLSPSVSPVVTEKQINFFVTDPQLQSGSDFTVPATGNPNLINPATFEENIALSHSLVAPAPAVSNGVQNFTVLPPKNSSPLLTNGASASPSSVTEPPLIHQFPTSPMPQTKPLPTTTPLPFPTTTPAPIPTLAEQLRVKGDKSLSRLAPLTIADNGRPRVMIPDAVFQKGADLHKDFIVCYFNGRAPSFHQIQSVLNHMWGKGKRLEIHNNPLTHSAIVRIPSDYLRQKILEKYIWFVGDSMFHTALWAESHSSTTPILSSIQIWAHLTGVPLDLRHQQGLSLVAGLVGDPKETDDFTLNLVSLALSHVKVEVDLTKPLPKVVEFSRQSGEVVEVQVDYPWLPATCTHCHELGHIMRNCLKIPLSPIPPATGNKHVRRVPVPQSKVPVTTNSSNKFVAKKNLPPTVPASSVPEPASQPSSSLNPPPVTSS